MLYYVSYWNHSTFKLSMGEFCTYTINFDINASNNVLLV